MRFVLSFVISVLISATSGSSQCSKYDFPCENGECVDSGLWCDSSKDCSDGSDEKYCKKSSLWSSDPNKCPKAYFKCLDGPCIPAAGRCDGYENCGDSSDEEKCEQPDSSLESDDKSPKAVTTLETRTPASTSTTSKTFVKSSVESQGHGSMGFYDSLDTVHHSGQRVYSDLRPSDYSQQRENARNWLISQMRSDFGWGDETPRALTGLYLSDEGSVGRKEGDLLMMKQLEVQLSLGIARNGTKAMKLTDLALYINALLASCKDPKNFYGENLVRTLRNSVSAAQRHAIFINPSVYLTLCINNASAHDDTRKLHDLLVSRNVGIGRMDIQALALLTTTCIYRNTNFVPLETYEGLKKQFFHRMNVSGLPGNVYEASLLAQALRELKASQPGLLEFILKQQQKDGSFGGILATYLVLPVISGRSFLQMKDHCSQGYTTDLTPLEVLKNSKRRKIFIRYALNYGYPTELTQTIQMQVAEGTNFLDVMRLAQEINPKYRFLLDGNSDIPVVYSIGGIPNDAEKGMFWTLNLASNSNRGAERPTPYSGNIKELIPHPGDEFVFWMRSI